MFAIQCYSHYNANRPAVKTHSSLPGLQYLQRVLQIEKRRIEQYITETSAQYHSCENIEKKNVDLIERENFFVPQQKISRQKTERIHKPVIGGRNGNPPKRKVKNSHRIKIQIPCVSIRRSVFFAIFYKKHFWYRVGNDPTVICPCFNI